MSDTDKYECPVCIDYSIKLPETEFDIINIIWNTDSKVNTAYLMNEIGNRKGWKLPTLISFLVRLERRGYIKSEKEGKERHYYSISDKNRYIQTITEDFVNKYHDGSFISVLDTLYKDKKFDTNEVDELLSWLKKKYV